MNVNRRDFIGGTLAALGFSALPGGLIFAAPTGWKHGGKPNLVFGVVSDTHLRTANKGNGIGANWPDKYFAAALEYFKAQGVDAVVHCGDFAHRGQTHEMDFHAEAWRRVFAPDCHFAPLADGETMKVELSLREFRKSRALKSPKTGALHVSVRPREVFGGIGRAIETDAICSKA